MHTIIKLAFDTFLLIAVFSVLFSKDVRVKLYAFIDVVLDRFGW